MDLALAIHRLLSRHRALPVLLLGGLLANQVAYADSPVVTQYTYDAGDNVATVTDPRGLVTSYTHDGLGQLWQQSSPDTGTTSYAYDSDGRRSSMTRADNTQTTYGYDGLNRVTSVSAGGLTQSFTYDSCTNGIGRLCSDSDATGATSYSYTPEGWVAGRGFSIGTTTYALGYGHDSVGHITTVNYPDGNQANYTYTNGVVSSVALTVGGTVVNGATSISYQPMNRGMTAWMSSNGLVNSMSYDTDGRLTGISAAGVESLGLTYDTAGRITQIANGINGNLTQDFGYDAMSRLVSVYSGADNESYQYDANGNRTTQTVNGASTIVNPSATSNQIASTSGASSLQYGYDAKGNTTTLNGTATYSYDAFNRLNSAGGMSYYVNPEGQRLRKTGAAGTTWFAPDQGGSLLAENAAGSWIDYVWLNGRLIGRIGGGTVDAIHADQVGRPEEMTNAAQAVVWRAQNYPFTQQVTVATVALNLGFPGQYYDAETGNWNNGFRDYSSGLGRYIESDPLGLIAGANTYAYVGGNPLSYTDPYGLANLLLGGNVNAIVVGGFTLSGGIYVSWGQGFDIGVYGSVGGGVGVDLGAGVSAGYVPGSSSNIAGQTLDLQGSIGPVTGSGSVAITSNGCKSYGSGSIGAGLGLPLGGALTSTFTNTFGLSNIMSLIHGH
ncbi:MAG: RHS repeat-associated core domain-containing protein [Rhodanobacter sp.]